jgi:S-DNA-T family DNA segregation ATPase FtsK/SpoIIIE
MSKVSGLAEELAHGLNVDRVRIRRNKGAINVEIPRPDPGRVLLQPLMDRLPEIPFCSAVLGLADDGSPLLIQLPSTQVAHVLVAGTTGSGKTALARTFVTSLAMKHNPLAVRFVLIDPKRHYADLARLPHLVCPVIEKPTEAAQVLARLARLMELRDREKTITPRIIVAIDELVDLLLVAPEAEKPLTRLAQRGRSAGIHLLACTQKPAASVIGGLTKANFPVRLVAWVTSPEDAKVATGHARTGAEKLLPPGDFLAVYAGHEPRRFQAAYIPKADLTVIVDRLIEEHPNVEPLTLPDLDTAAPASQDDEKFKGYVETARPVYEELVDGNDGELPYGGKAELADAVFGIRDTGGHRGKWLDRVIDALVSDNGAQETVTAAAPKTTTTTETSSRIRVRKDRYEGARCSTGSLRYSTGSPPP